jgi:RND family efflux transporter MFP subunit
MKKSLVFVAAVAALTMVGCGKRDISQEDTRTIQEIQAEMGIPVRIATAQPGIARHIEKTSGTAEGIRQTVVSNGMGGQLQKILVRTGQRVKEGDVIARMFFEDGSPRTVAQANYDLAERTFERVQRLFEEGAATQEQVEGTRVQLENARKNLKGANVAEFITAPFDGVILEIFESEGTKIGGGTRLVNMADFSRIKIDAMVNQLNIHKYSNGQRAFVITGDNDTLWGKATSVAVGGGSTHNFRVTFEFPNSQNELKVGMFKEIFVVIEEKQNAISVPIDVVVYKEGRPGVFVINGDVAKLRPVEMGINSGSLVEIKKGVLEGEQYVIAGTSLLHNGAKIRITE